MEKDQRTYFIKRLLYKSNYRGCKETDLILGRFAKKYVESLSDNELVEFDSILNQMDPDIWDQLHHKADIPSHISKDLMQKIASTI